MQEMSQASVDGEPMTQEKFGQYFRPQVDQQRLVTVIKAETSSVVQAMATEVSKKG